MSQNPPNNNPYAKAAGSYGKQAKETDDQRELEAQALLKAASELQKLHDRIDEATPEDVNNILLYNRKLWLMFFDAAVENPDGDRPDPLRSNIINLCNFIFKRSVDIQADPKPEKIAVLIDINREIAAGLREKPNKPDSSGPSSPPAGGSDEGVSTSI